MDLKYLNTFRVAVEEGGFSKAAKRLNYTQSTITFQIGQLAHTIELWSIPAIKELVKSDVGISFLPLFTVQEELDNGTLVRIPTDLDGRLITAICTHHKSKWVGPLMQLFIRQVNALPGTERR